MAIWIAIFPIRMRLLQTEYWQEYGLKPLNVFVPQISVIPERTMHYMPFKSHSMSLKKGVSASRTCFRSY